MKKRVVFCTYPSLYSDIVLSTLLSSADVEVVGVVISTRTANTHDNFLRGAWRHIKRSGVYYSLYQWAVTQGYEDSRKWRGKPSLRQRVEDMGVPVLPTQNINQPDSLEFIKGIKAEILLCAHFNQLIESTLLNLPSLSCLNIHPSLLPHYKGVDPGFFMLLDDAKTMGVTVHLQSEVFDEGDILMQRTLHNPPKQSLVSLNRALFQLGADAAVDVITLDSWDPQPQSADGRYDSWPSKAQVCLFRKQHRLLYKGF